MSKISDILKILSDGKFHSGTEIGQQLHLTRSAVAKFIQQLDELNIDVFSVKGKGYKIAGGLSLLSEKDIRAGLSDEVRDEISLEVFTNIASTNTYLKQTSLDTSFRACMAEYQHQGRGRLGRSWQSPFGSNLILSIAHRHKGTPATLSGYSLCIGTALRDCLEPLVNADIGLKWPNDLKVNNKKLAGILIEIVSSRNESGEPVFKVITGIGVNYHLSAEARSQIDQPVEDLSSLTKNRLPSRSELGALIINSTVAAIKRFESEGFSAFKEKWLSHDIHLGSKVRLSSESKTIEGIHRGITDSGELILERQGRLIQYSVGELEEEIEGAFTD